MGDQDFTDEIGLYFQFEVTLTDQSKLLSDTGYIFIDFPSGDIPGLSFGNQPSNYQIISIPLDLDNENVSNVFSALEGKNIKQWRLFHYQNGETQEFQEGFTTIQTGKGYWLIVRSSTVIDPGPGKTVEVTFDQPFPIVLNDGFNQIGNPYSFNVSWREVLALNGNPSGVGNLQIFSGGTTLTESTRLDSFGGGFVLVDPGFGPVILKIPFKKNNIINGRSAGPEFNNVIEA